MIFISKIFDRIFLWVYLFSKMTVYILMFWKIETLHLSIMIYCECRPHIALLPYVETYWLANGFADGKESHKILPDGCVDIIFSFGESSESDRLKQFVSNIIGAMTTFSRVDYFGEVRIQREIKSFFYTHLKISNSYLCM